MKTTTCIFFFGILTAFCGSAIANQIYRCGKVYQQQPCPGGKAIDTTSALEGFKTPRSQSMNSQAINDPVSNEGVCPALHVRLVEIERSTWETITPSQMQDRWAERQAIAARMLKLHC